MAEEDRDTGAEERDVNTDRNLDAANADTGLEGAKASSDESTEEGQKGVNEANADDGKQPEGQKPQDAPAQAPKERPDEHDRTKTAIRTDPERGYTPRDVDEETVKRGVDHKGDEYFRRDFIVPGEPHVWEGANHVDNHRAIVSEAINNGHRPLAEPELEGADRKDDGFGHVNTVLRFRVKITDGANVGAEGPADTPREFVQEDVLNPSDFASTSTGGVLSEQQLKAIKNDEEVPEDQPSESVRTEDGRPGHPHEGWSPNRGEQIREDEADSSDE